MAELDRFEKVNCPECGMFAVVRIGESGEKVVLADIVTKCAQGLPTLSASACRNFKLVILAAQDRLRK